MIAREAKLRRQPASMKRQGLQRNRQAIADCLYRRLRGHGRSVPTPCDDVQLHGKRRFDLERAQAFQPVQESVDGRCSLLGAGQEFFRTRWPYDIGGRTGLVAMDPNEGGPRRDRDGSTVDEATAVEALQIDEFASTKAYDDRSEFQEAAR